MDGTDTADPTGDTGSGTAAAVVVGRLWARIEARDWDGLGRLLADDVVLEYPVSGELIRGRANVVAVNAEYPTGWSVHVLRVLGGSRAAGAEAVAVSGAGAVSEAVSEVEVPFEGLPTSRAVSWWTVAAGRVTHVREYWTVPGSEEPPAWRRPFAERT